MKVNNSPSSLHLFKQQGILYVTPDPERPNLDLEEIAIECEAEDVTKETNEEGQEVIKVSSGFLLAKAKKKKMFCSQVPPLWAKCCHNDYFYIKKGKNSILGQKKLMFCFSVTNTLGQM